MVPNEPCWPQTQTRSLAQHTQYALKHAVNDLEHVGYLAPSVGTLSCRAARQCWRQIRW
jgi:hypothetical protein